MPMFRAAYNYGASVFTVVPISSRVRYCSRSDCIAIGGNIVAILGDIGLGTFIATSFPVIVGYQWRKTSREAALAAEILTLVLTIAFTLAYEGAMKRHLWAGVPDYACIILLFVVIMVFVSLLTNGAAGDLLPEKMKVYFNHME